MLLVKFRSLHRMFVEIWVYFIVHMWPICKGRGPYEGQGTLLGHSISLSQIRKGQLEQFFHASNPTPRLIKSVHFSFFLQTTKLNGFIFFWNFGLKWRNGVEDGVECNSNTMMALITMYVLIKLKKIKLNDPKKILILK